MAASSLTQELIEEFFYYKDGVLFWKKDRPNTKVKAHMPAGRRVTQGYLQTCINGHRVMNHQIIFMMFHGYVPKEIDHIDKKRDNNCIENLKATTRSDNLKNRRKWKWTKKWLQPQPMP